MTPNEQLLQASRNADLDSALSAIANGADVNTCEDRGWTPFMNAAWNSDTIMMDRLRSAGAKTAALSLDGYSAAHYAARAGRTNSMRSLSIEEINQPDADGLTPIFYAALFGHATTFQALVRLGADDKRKTKHGHTCYDYARLFGKRVA